MAFAHRYYVVTPLGKVNVGWKVFLSHREVKNISTGASALSAILAPTGIGTTAIVAIQAAGLALKAIDRLGGNDGVKIVYLRTGGAWVEPR